MNKPATTREIKNLLALHSCTMVIEYLGGWITVKCSHSGSTWRGISTHHDIEWWMDWIKRAGISS